eukprot:Stramenopile-MAST_4_protein_5056
MPTDAPVSAEPSTDSVSPSSAFLMLLPYVSALLFGFAGIYIWKRKAREAAQAEAQKRQLVRIKQLDEELRNAQIHAEEAQHELTKTISRLRAEAEEQKKKYATLEIHAKEANAETEHLKAKVGNITEEIQNKVLEIEYKSRNIKLLRDRIDKLEHGVEALEGEKQRLNSQVVLLIDENKRQQQQVESLHSSNKTRQNIVESLESDINNIVQAHEDANRDLLCQHEAQLAMERKKWQQATVHIYARHVLTKMCNGLKYKAFYHLKNNMSHAHQLQEKAEHIRKHQILMEKQAKRLEKDKHEMEARVCEMEKQLSEHRQASKTDQQHCAKLLVKGALLRSAKNTVGGFFNRWKLAAYKLTLSLELSELKTQHMDAMEMQTKLKEEMTQKMEARVCEMEKQLSEHRQASKTDQQHCAKLLVKGALLRSAKNTVGGFFNRWKLAAYKLT